MIMRSLTEMEMQNINGGEITLDVNELVDQLNPMQWMYDFGHDVVYPYVWKPLTGLFE
ncbi:MAG: hypothetical protein IJF07_08140 [Lachnospiraceae bacterium]|nr:hypothetical protein [Lachnospiraceae bacterium]